MPKFRVVRGAATSIACDVLAVPVYRGGEPGPGAEAVERKLGAKLKDLLGAARTKGEPGEAVAVPTLGKLKAKQVLLVGMGAKGAGTDAARKAGATVARRTGAATVVATTIPNAVKGPAAESAASFVEGYLLGSYRFDRYKRSNGQKSSTKEVLLAGGRGDKRAVQRAIGRAAVLADATALAMNYVTRGKFVQS